MINKQLKHIIYTLGKRKVGVFFLRYIAAEHSEVAGYYRRFGYVVLAFELRDIFNYLAAYVSLFWCWEAFALGSLAQRLTDTFDTPSLSAISVCDSPCINKVLATSRSFVCFFCPIYMLFSLWCKIISYGLGRKKLLPLWHKFLAGGIWR